MSQVLVTGGAGFIGSHLVELLLQQGHRVRVLDDLSSGSLENLSSCQKQIQFIRADVCDFESVRKAASGIDTLFHLAAAHSVQESMVDPDRYLRVNPLGTLQVLRAASALQKIRVVYVSSSSVYGNPETIPFREDLVPAPLSPYGASKLVGEITCGLFSRGYGVPTVSLRYFNVYGPRQPMEGDYAKVIPKFLRQMSQDESPTVYGDGTQKRDFTYVEDVAAATAAAATTSLCQGDVFNIGNGEPHTVLEVVQAINQALGKNLEPTFVPLPAGEALLTMADLHRAHQHLHFSPRVSFQEGIRRTVGWWQTQGHARTVR